MEIWQAIILGAVQGFAEFLPISSSGHLTLLSNWFGIKENTLFYSVMFHLGTLVPIIIILWKKILGLFKSPFSLLKCLIIATIPAGIVGIICSLIFDLDKIFETNSYLLSIAFMVTALQMFLADRISKKQKSTFKINKKTAVIMGCGQAIAIFPGISRSGSTLFFGCLARANKKDNAEFTFLMSIPIILSAIVLESTNLITSGQSISIDFIPLFFGIVTAGICGYISINFMLKIIKKAKFFWFSIYLVGISIINLIIYLI